MRGNPTRDRKRGPGYETRDTNLRVVTWLGVGIAGLIAVAMVAMWLLFGALERREERAQPAPLSMLRGPGRAEPPEPRLQVTPRQDLAAVRAREDELLHGYAWTDADTGTVRIPIERAMDLLAERGLPARPAPPSATAEGASR